MPKLDSLSARLTESQLAGVIDHTCLQPDAQASDIRQLCLEGKECGFGAVCVAPCWVSLAAHLLAEAPVRVVSVIAFPHGNTLTRIKAAESEAALEAGATELDMVMNLGALKAGDRIAVVEDIRAVVEVAHQKIDRRVKVIIETSLLSNEEKLLACELVQEAKADFVKTSTGFGPGGATPHDVALIRKAVGSQLGVKAAGGIRDLATAVALLAAGATRLGCSRSVGILVELRQSRRETA